MTLTVHNFKGDYGARFFTMAEELRINARRHRLRCLLHMASGKPAYAFGSWMKAIRNDERAKALEAAMKL